MVRQRRVLPPRPHAPHIVRGLAVADLTLKFSELYEGRRIEFAHEGNVESRCRHGGGGLE